MFTRITNTWAVMGECWNVLQKNKRLLLFPMLSGICTLIVIVSFLIPIIATDAWRLPKQSSSQAQQILYYGGIFLFYLCNYFVVIFFNAATTACAVKCLRGEEASLSDGLREAGSRLHLIVGWALVSATVGLILQVIEDRSEKIGRIVSGLLGVAWSVVTYLVVPILVIDRKGPFAALKESTRLVKVTWGEEVVSGLSFGLLNLLFIIPAFLIMGVGIFSAAGESKFLFALCMGLGVLWILTVGLIVTVLQNIFRTALYLYVRHGETTSFSSDALGGAMQPKA